MRWVADIRIERFHARYDAAPPERALALDRALEHLCGGALDDLLAQAVGPELARSWAVCIPEVSVEVTLGDGGVAAWTGAWAEAIATAVRTALEGASGTASGDAEIVVFATRGDALVDLVRCTALDDRRHVWAWRQAGLGADAVAALREEPLLVPGVLRAVGPVLFGQMVTPAELVDLAAAVARAAGAADPASRTADAAPEVGRPDARAAMRGAAAAVASLPVGVRRWSADVGDVRGAGLEELAVLAALTASPLRAGDPVFLAAVATALTGSATASTVAPAAEEAAEQVAEQVAGDVREASVEAGDATDWGGVWFLAAGLRDLGLVAVTSAPELALLVATFTGAPYADVSVRLFCGLGDDDPFEPPAELPEPDPAALAALAVWVEERVDGRWDEEPEEPRATWRRAARIHRHPGEIEVAFSLFDVDPVVRAAGLDLDPGWVAWLGVFVRFSYA